MSDEPVGLPHSPWSASTEDQPPGGDAFPAAADALRRLQDTFMFGAPPDVSTWTTVARLLDEADCLLRPFQVRERDRVSGRRPDLPGRGQTMTPAVHVDEWSDHHLRGRVTFGRFYLGGNRAVHGGAIPLMFDEVLGRLANTRRPRSRTAYLNVDYRAITPLEVEVEVHARIDREEGRKVFVAGDLRLDGTLLAEAESLFVTLNEGQP